MPRFGRMGVIPASLIAASILAGCEGEPSTSNTRVGTLQFVSGNNQSGTVGLLLGEQLVVRLIDQFGRPVVGEAVVFLPDTASALLGATPEPAVDTTGSDGIASTQLRLGTGTGPYRVNAIWRVRELFAPLHIVAFTATAGPAPAAALAILSGNNQTAPTDSPLPQALLVRVTDAFGNPVADASVTFLIASGGGALSVTEAVTSASGTASTNWTLGPDVGAQSVTAFISGVAPVTFNATAL